MNSTVLPVQRKNILYEADIPEKTKETTTVKHSIVNIYRNFKLFYSQVWFI